MKEWVAKTTPARGRGRHRRLRRAVRRRRARRDYARRCWRPRPTASAPRSPIAQAMDVHDTIGFDLVGMVVDDLVVCGAEPLFMTDYIACGRVVPGADRGDRPGHRRGLRRWPAAPCSAARPPSTPACSAPTSTTSPAPPPAWSRPTGCSGADRVRPGDVRRCDGLLRPALQRLLAGPARAARARRLGARPRRRRAGPHPRRRAARARPGSTPGTASTCPCAADRRGRGARDQPRHRRRAGRQPRPGAAGAA